MNKSRAKTKEGKIITWPLAQRAYLSLLIAVMLLTSMRRCEHVRACTQTHARAKSCMHMLLFFFLVHKRSMNISEHRLQTLIQKLAWAVSCRCREVHNDNYSLGLHPWIKQIRHTHTPAHTISKCQGLLWCALTGAQCWSSLVLGSGSFDYCSPLKPPGNNLSRTKRCARSIKLQSNQQRLTETKLLLRVLCNNMSL